ncbi:MAG: MoaD/ThiS family protein [Deltaproteobacteria bacterium]|nr:MoaD/ThiS family protein [Deltaproteobacteria bacterium]
MIRVLFFGMLATKTGVRETHLELKRPGATLSDVMEELGKRFALPPKAPYMLAVNEAQADPSTVLKDGDEVAVMPPFSGGLG